MDYWTLPAGDVDIYSGLTAVVMKKELSLQDCFDAEPSRIRLNKVRTLVWAFIIGFCLFVAAGVTMLYFYGIDPARKGSIALLVFGVISCVLTVGLFVGAIVTAVKMTDVMDGDSVCKERILQEAAMRTKEYRAMLSDEVSEPEQLIEVDGFYFNDIDTPCLQRTIDGTPLCSNYQVSQIYVNGGCLYYATQLFSLIGEEKHTMRGCVPFDKITAIELIKANGIDLFCPQLKIAFGDRCMLFAVDPCEARIKIDDLHDFILGQQ